MDRGKNTWSDDSTRKTELVFLPFTPDANLFRMHGMGFRTENPEHIHFEIESNFKVNIACKQQKHLDDIAFSGAKFWSCNYQDKATWEKFFSLKQNPDYQETSIAFFDISNMFLLQWYPVWFTVVESVSKEDM